MNEYDVSEFDVVIPEPFWVRSLRTLFCWRPACYTCRRRFRTVGGWRQHWLAYHQERNR